MLDKYMSVVEMRDELDALRGRQRRLLSQAGDIADKGKAEDRALTDGEQEKIDGLSRAVDKISDELAEGEMQLAEKERAETRIMDIYRNQPGSRLEPGIAPHAESDRSDHGDPRTRADRDAGLRAIERNQHALTPQAADRLDSYVRRDNLGVDARYLAAVGDPAYNEAFGKVVADPTHGHLRLNPQEVAAMQRVSGIQSERAHMATTSGAVGGFALPFTLDPSVLLSSNGALNPIRQVARVFTINTREWKGVSSEGVTASYVAEASEATDASPTLAQPAITTAQGRAFIPFSIELGQDWGALQQELVRLISDGRDVVDATKFLSGDGSDEPVASSLSALRARSRPPSA